MVFAWIRADSRIVSPLLKWQAQAVCAQKSRGVRTRIVLVMAALIFTCTHLRAQETAPWHEMKPIQAGQLPSILAFSPDDTRLVSASRTRWLERADGRVKLAENAVTIFDFRNLRKPRRLGRHGQALVSVGWLSAQSLAVVYNESNGAQHAALWDAQTWRKPALRTLFDPKQRPLGELAGSRNREAAGEFGVFSEDGTLFASHYGYVAGQVVPPWHFVGRTVVWQTADWRPRASWNRNPGADTALIFFTSDGQVLADSPAQSGPRGDDVRYTTTEPVFRMTAPFYLLDDDPRAGHTIQYWGPQPAQTLSSDGRWLIASVMNNVAGSLIRYDVDRGSVLLPESYPIDTNPRMRADRYYTALALSPDNHWLITGQVDGTIKMWDTDSWEPVQEVRATHRTEVQVIAFSHDGQTFAAGFDDNTIRLWHL